MSSTMIMIIGFIFAGVTVVIVFGAVLAHLGSDKSDKSIHDVSTDMEDIYGQQGEPITEIEKVIDYSAEQTKQYLK